MTVYIEKPAVNLREELASLRNQGGYEERQFWFENAVTNGTFDANTSGWTAGQGAVLSVVSGKIRVENGSTNYGYASQGISTVAGKTYIVNFDFTKSTVNAYFRVSNTEGGSGVGSIGVMTASGSYSFTFVAQQSTSYLSLTFASNVIGNYAEYDNISVYEVDANDDVVHRMPKGWVPLHVYEDGLLQREGAANDYEVVYDGFDYYVKPAVAPSATTQTCVIGVRK